MRLIFHQGVGFSYEIMCQGQKHLESVMADYKQRMDTLSKKEQDSYRDMKLVQEMYARGFEFEPIDIFSAHSRNFQIVDGKLMPSLNSIDGLGENGGGRHWWRRQRTVPSSPRMISGREPRCRRPWLI